MIILLNIGIKNKFMLDLFSFVGLCFPLILMKLRLSRRNCQRNANLF